MSTQENLDTTATQKADATAPTYPAPKKLLKTKEGKRHPLRLACDIIIFVFVLVFALSLQMAPVLSIYGGTSSISTVNLLLTGEFTVFEHLVDSYASVFNSSSSPSSLMENLIETVEATVVLVGIIVILVQSTVNFIRAIVNFSNKNSQKLTQNLLNLVIDALALKMSLSFFNGLTLDGNPTYYITPFINTLMFLGVLLLTFDAIANLVITGKNPTRQDTANNWALSVCTAVGYLIVGSCFFSSGWYSVIYNVAMRFVSVTELSGGEDMLEWFVHFSVSVFYAVFLNIIYTKTKNAVRGAFSYTLYYGTNVKTLAKKEKNSIVRTSNADFISLIVLTAIVVFFAAVMTFVFESGERVSEMATAALWALVLSINLQIARAIIAKVVKKPN